MNTEYKEKPAVENKTSYVGYALLLILYLVAAVLASLTAQSRNILTVGQYTLPANTFTAVFSSFANILLFFLVVLYRKPGFITSLIILILQFPMIVIGIVSRHNLASIPGLFTNVFTITAIVLIYRSGRRIEEYRTKEILHLKEQQLISQRLFEQTATALVNAIDAKDTYSHGHSLRVARYSEKIAEMLGKSEEECYKIYYAALLHDVGKIGIDERIINKDGKLTKEEYEIIKQHPIMGNQILSSINEYPYLSIGAHYHHERYDGKGYPDGLKAGEIPEIARIISVADAYDAMSSNRSYRTAIPQHIVREEIAKGAGTQFDPVFADIMLRLIDLDTEYQMKEKKSGQLS
ncbi:MAG: HD-GYP domain-containing protein [Lachnospiraceae bacterium]|nr:HD-GYP domain-containing protein [Lachnospiraceae bacterium]